MTKAQRILTLHAEGRTTRQIAEAVYGIGPTDAWAEADRKMAYVRVVIRQRGGSSESEADHKYRRSSGGKRRIAARFKKKYQTDPAFRERHLGYCVTTRRRRSEASP